MAESEIARLQDEVRRLRAALGSILDRVERASDPSVPTTQWAALVWINKDARAALSSEGT